MGRRSNRLCGRRALIPFRLGRGDADVLRRQARMGSPCVLGLLSVSFQLRHLPLPHDHFFQNVKLAVLVVSLVSYSHFLPIILNTKGIITQKTRSQTWFSDIIFGVLSRNKIHRGLDYFCFLQDYNIFLFCFLCLK